MNVSATFNVLRLILSPSLCLPHATVSNFNQLPVPVSKAFPKNASGEHPDIRAVVLDKDNCFAIPKENTVYSGYEAKFRSLRSAYPNSLLIVSNSAGTATGDPTLSHASLLTKNTEVPVLSHRTKKPGCKDEIMKWFADHPESGVTHPSQVAVVGDRLATDMLMANMSGMWGVWVREGVVKPRGLEGFFVGLEKGLAGLLLRRGHVPPTPASPFE